VKIIQLHNIRDQHKLNFEIEIDGGVNKETSQICKNSGADVLVAGSYIFSGAKDNYKTLIDSLR
jgi:ribulose-phosphate 3-epimerase